jgi:hypothetical protein
MKANKSLQPTATALSVTDERCIVRSRHASCFAPGAPSLLSDSCRESFSVAAAEL